MWVFIDCYDSFSFSLIDLLKRFHQEIVVLNYDDPQLISKIELLAPARLIFSPGPGHPRDYLSIFRLIDLYKHVPILGVCLGHQIIGEYFGYSCLASGAPLHGKTSNLIIKDIDHPIFKGIENSELTIMHYHSLIVELTDTDGQINCLAIDEKKQVMMIEHQNLPILGIQFHPESILTTCGEQLVENWSLLY